MPSTQTFPLSSTRAYEVTGPDGVTLTVQNLGPDSCYYATASTVSSGSNDGTLTSGSSMSFTPSKFFISAGSSRLQITTPTERQALPLLGELKRSALMPTGAIDETIPRGLVATGATPLGVSGRLTLIGTVELRANQAVASATVVSGTTAMVTPANQWFTLVRVSDGLILGKSTDDLTTAWSTSVPKTLALVVTAQLVDTLCYLGVVVTAATMPTLSGYTGLSAVTGLAPKLGGLADTGLTTPASLVGPNIGAISNAGGQGYGYIS